MQIMKILLCVLFLSCVSEVLAEWSLESSLGQAWIVCSAEFLAVFTM